MSEANIPISPVAGAPAPIPVVESTVDAHRVERMFHEH